MYEYIRYIKWYVYIFFLLCISFANDTDADY